MCWVHKKTESAAGDKTKLPAVTIPSPIYILWRGKNVGIMESLSVSKNTGRETFDRQSLKSLILLLVCHLPSAQTSMQGENFNDRGNETSLFSLFFPISPPPPSFDDAIFEKKSEKRRRGERDACRDLSLRFLPPSPPFSKEPPSFPHSFSLCASGSVFFLFFAFKCAPTSPNSKNFHV